MASHQNGREIKEKSGAVGGEGQNIEANVSPSTSPTKLRSKLFPIKIFRHINTCRTRTFITN